MGRNKQSRGQYKNSVYQQGPPTNASVSSPNQKKRPLAIHTPLLNLQGNPYNRRCYSGLESIAYSTSPTILAASLYVVSSFSHFSRSALMVSSSYRSSWKRSSL